MEQLELFGEHEIDRKLQSPNPMVRAFGFGPAEKNCRTCSHLVIHQPGQNRYYKCRQRGITNGPATDHRVRWPACSKYQESEETDIERKPHPKEDPRLPERLAELLRSE